MNKMIKMLLSVLMVSLSTLFAPLDIYDENTEIELMTFQLTEIDIRSVENEVKECTEESGILIGSEINVIQKRMRQEMLEIESIEDKQEWFLAYKDIIYDYAKWFGIPQTVFDVYTEEEIILICRAVETECYDQDFMSKCNVASVILNRVEQRGEFGNSVTEVITKENQFAYRRENITKSTILSIMYVYEIGDTTDGCVAFRSDKCPTTWYGWKHMFTDAAGHHFYK